MRPIERRRFDALAGYTRRPESVYFMRELSWYEEGDETLLGVVGLDTSDDDYVAIVLARDAKLRFRAVDLRHSLETQAEAAIWLRERLAVLFSAPAESHYQGDEVGAPVDFFGPVAELARRSAAFELLRREARYSPALGLLRELMHYFEDADGNFVEQFQSTGFDTRIWEICLYALFIEAGYALDRTHAVPDFHCTSPRGEFFVEATSIGESPVPVEITDSNEESYFNDYLPIRYAGVLTSKLNRENPYWKMPHVEGHPLVLAVQDFHAPGSMKWSGDGLVQYLYGVRHVEQGGGAITQPVVQHSWVHRRSRRTSSVCQARSISARSSRTRRVRSRSSRAWDFSPASASGPCGYCVADSRSKGRGPLSRRCSSVTYPRVTTTRRGLRVSPSTTTPTRVFRFQRPHCLTSRTSG